MLSELEIIQHWDILEALNLINGNYIYDEDWLFYDLEFKGNLYPPMQIVELAYTIASDGKFIKIYSIEDTIEILVRNDFRVTQKNTIWKLGCNWGRGAPSFYELVKKEHVVLDYGNFAIDDLILITEGFTVRALGKITGQKTSITNNNELFSLFKEYRVFDEDIFLHEIEFYELPKIDVFNYELQQGIVKVRRKPVLYKAINLWQNKDVRSGQEPIQNEEIIFRAFFYRNNDFKNWQFPCIGLRHLTNEKNGMRNSFQMTYFYDEKNKIDIGIVLIYMKDNYITELESEFSILDLRYCSIGSTVDFYYRLKEVLPLQYDDVLKQLNDIARNSDVRKLFENNVDVKNSLLNTSESQFILNNFEEIIFSQISDKKYEFKFNVRIGKAIADHSVDFTFGKSKELKNRFFCLVGKNATGKTKYLSHLANKLSDFNESGDFIPLRPSFSKIITASFSFFDKFRFSNKIDSNYEFIGIRNNNGWVNEEDYFQLVWESYKNIVYNKEKNDLWFRSLQSSLELSHLNFEFDELQDIKGKEDFLRKTQDIFSSGQNIIFQFLTRFIESIENNSLLIFDEPETHLHPNIVGRLLRTINSILIEYKSFAILATHSPIILQEIPSNYIRIFDRQDDFPIIYEPTIECYGEDISTISNMIFKIEEEKEIYKSTFENLFESGNNYNDILDLFHNRLGLSARILLKSLEK